jgi:hypothetical protein
MESKEVLKNIGKGLIALYHFNPELILNKTEEESISAQLMCCLKPYFKEWDVDVEYNHDGKKSKEGESGNKIYPDIIIHHRTPSSINSFSPENNLVAIEVKGFWNKEDRTKDTNKLRYMKERYGYQNIFRIELKELYGEIIPID